jgi:dTDP-4-amino-4,6-dideoxygalactose transaminase
LLCLSKTSLPTTYEHAAGLNAENSGPDRNPLPLHLQECYGNLDYKKSDFIESEKASKELLALPIFPELTDEMKKYVADTIISFFD